MINVPTSLSMNTLTLNGRGPNSDLGSSITIGTNASTWTLGDGTTSTVNLNSALGGGGANRDLRYTIGAYIMLAGDASGITTFTGASTSGYGAVFSGNIGESVAGKGITKSGSSLLVFSGNNNYTGTTAVTGGVLRLSSTTALSGGIGTSGGTSALTINGGVVELGAGDFSRGLGTGSSQFQITGGTSGFSAYGGPRVVTVGGDASLELQWGSTHFQPGTLVLNQAYGFNANVSPYLNGSIKLTNKIDLNGSTRTVQVGANYALISGDIRTTSGTAGLTKTGAGTLVLTGNNTYNGTTTITGGTLSISASNNLGTAASLVLDGTNVTVGGTIQIRGTALTSFSGLATSVAVTATRAVGFNIQDAANTFTVNQVLNQTTGTFTKSGVGTLVLNQNNTFTGATTATGGGTLVLDYTTNNGSKLSDTTALTLNGSALVLKGGIGAGANHTEVVLSTTLTANSSNSISRDGGSSKISLGTLTLNNFSTLAISEADLATTSVTTANVNGILTLGRVTVGSDFGTKDGSNNIVAYSIPGGNQYTAATTTGGVGTTSIVTQLNGGGTMAGQLNGYSIRIVNSGSGDVLELGANRLNLSNNGTLLYAGGSDNNYTINGTTGFINSNSSNQPFIVNTFAGTTLTVNAQLGSNFAGFVKAGEGTLVVGASNTKLALTKYIQQGVLRLTSAGGLGTDYARAQAVIVQGGASLELSNNIDVGAQALDLNGVGISNGGALRNLSGTNSWAGLITTGASGARINSDVSSSLLLTGGIVTTLTQDVTFGGAGNTTVSTTAITGSGSLIKDGNGTLTLSAVNTYTGATLVSAGTLFVSGSLVSDVTVSDTATLAGGGTVDDLILGGGSFFDLFLAVNSADSLTATTISFSTAGFGIDNLLANGAAVNWGAINNGTYTLITGTLNSTNLGNFGSANAYDIGGGRTAYFQDGSLQLVVIPEPSVALLNALSLILLLRRRR